jgi:hypothetical protein
MGLAMSALCSKSAAEELRLEAGMNELGIRAAFISDGATQQNEFGLRFGHFFGAPREALVNLEGEFAYAKLLDLDRLEMTSRVGVLPPFSNTSLQPSLSLSVGVRQEWLGSFQRARYPIGIEAGLRVQTSQHSLVRFDFQLLRVLGDAVNDFTEKRLNFGVSLLFG